MTAIGKYDDQARAKGQEILELLRGDPSFRQRVEADPTGTLEAAGLPTHATADFLNEAGIRPDVEGFRACDNTCTWTCLITQC